MSASNIKRSFTTPLLNQLNTNEETRKRVEEQTGQILELQGAEAFRKVFVRTFGRPPGSAGKGKQKLQEAQTQAVTAGRKRAEGLQANFLRSAKGKRRYNRLKRLYTEDPGLKENDLGVNVFLVANFETSIAKVKTAMAEPFKELYNLTDEETKETLRSVQKGHGEQGHAVADHQVARAMMKASQQAGGLENFEDNLNLYIKELDINDEDKAYLEARVKSLVVDYKTMVTRTGKLKASFFSTITFQSSDDNAHDRRLEVLLVKTVRKFIIRDYPQILIESQGSGSIRDKIEARIVEDLTKKVSKNARVKVKTKSGLKNKGKPSAGTASSKDKAKAAKVSQVRRGHGKGRQARVAKSQTGIAQQPLALIGMLNKELPAVVRKNMQFPALENRTGRFAQSVKVTDITQTPQGYPSIGYTYQKNPYEIFEDGGGTAPWSNGQRDPRVLIDRSIREIAIKFAIGRFYTRRT